jgi:hypothetical protein
LDKNILELALAEVRNYEYPKGFVAPRNVAVAADAYATAKGERLALQKQVDALEVTERALKMWLISNLPKGEASGVSGKIARVKLVIKDIPIATDWKLLYKSMVDQYIMHSRKKDGLEDSAFAPINRSLTATSIKEVWADGGDVPGVGVMHRADLSLSKI